MCVVAQYRTSYEELKSLRTEVQYCQKLVDQCRQRLVQGTVRTLTLAPRAKYVPYRHCPPIYNQSAGLASNKHTLIKSKINFDTMSTRID